MPRRPSGLGLAAGEGLRLAASRDVFAADMVVRDDGGGLFLLRHEMQPDLFHGLTDAWVERVDPVTLEPDDASPMLSGGRFWPGSLAVLADGDLLAVYGRWAHRLSADLHVRKARRLPAPRPYNGVVVRDDGSIAIKDCDPVEAVAPSTLLLLDPDSLDDRCRPLPLGEPAVARLSSDGDDLVVVGVEHVMRVVVGEDAMEIADRVRYGGDPDWSYGWDAMLAADRVWWMDNGHHATHASLRLAGVAPGPVRLWHAAADDLSTAAAVAISGLPHGTQTNPPGWDPVGRQVIAFDSAHGVVRAWRVEQDDGCRLVPTWRRDDLAHGPRLIVLPDTREVVVTDRRDPPVARLAAGRSVVRRGRPLLANRAARGVMTRIAREDVVVLNLDTGVEKARTGVPSAVQSYVFPAPGADRDLYYLSSTTLGRIVVESAAD